jgi:hypothetical protein
MTTALTIRHSRAPRSASSPRRGATVELIVLDSDPRSFAVEAYTTNGSTFAPHYHIARDGSVTELVAEARAAHHSGLALWRGRRRRIDRISIGVTLEASRGAPYNAAQLTALGALVPAIQTRHGLGDDALRAWTPPARGAELGELTPVFLPRQTPSVPFAAGAKSMPAVLRAPAVLGAVEDQASGEQLWLALQDQAFKQRGGLGFQPGWAFHLHAANRNLGAPLAPAPTAERWVSHGGKRYNYQVFATDTIFNEGNQWTVVQSLAQLAGGTMPAAGTLALALLRASYDDALAAGPRTTGKTGLQPEQAMPQLALRERLGPALSGNRAINVAGAGYAMQVFAGDTLYTPIAPAGKPTNWGVVKRLSQEAPGALHDALWLETYRVSGAPYQPASLFHQTAAREQLGTPLSAVVRVASGGQSYETQVFARDTLFAIPGQLPRRASALPKPAAVRDWQPGTAAPGNPPTFARPGGNRYSAAWPPPPGFRFLSTADRERLFGRYSYQVKPDRTIVITDDWERANIIDVATPQLRRFGIASVKFHRRAAPQFQALLAAWERAGLLDRILSWNGSFVPRLMRKLDQLSAHAWGTAFDINAPQNGQGVTPPLVGQGGSVRELVPLANHHGFFWGGHFVGEFVDGMHFEVALLVQKP